VYQSYNISHADAQKMIATIQAELEEAKKAACIAVTDAHGELIAFLRMDGCHLPPLYVAMNKAFTAARERRESGEVGEASRKGVFPMTNFGDLRYTGWPGGCPIKHGGVVIGAIGVSGLTDEEDTAMARLAAALLN
jgi:glc operon protein GlcG